MENVPEVIGKKNIEHFSEWLMFLDGIGYKNKWQLLNAKDYGVPQNRNRCFMVSILGDYYYEFPQPIKLEKRLKDLLEDKVAEKYYLSDKTVKMFMEHTERQQANGNGFKFQPTDGEGTAHSILTRNGERPCDNYILSRPHGFNKGIISNSGIFPTVTQSATEQANCGVVEWKKSLTTDGSSPKHNNRVIEPTERFYQQALKTAQENDCDNGDIIDAYNGKVNKDGVSPTVTTRPEGFKTAILPIQDYRIRKLTPKECWRLMGFDDSDFEKAKSAGISDSQLYKQAGNSIVVNVLEAIFREMI